MNQQELESAIRAAESTLEVISRRELIAAAAVAAGVFGEFYFSFWRRSVDKRLQPLREELAGLRAQELAQLEVKTMQATADAEKAKAGALELQVELEKERNRITKVDARVASFSADVEVHFEWPDGMNPLLGTAVDGGVGGEELMWLQAGSHLVKLYAVGRYDVLRTGPTTGRFSAQLAPKTGTYPLGQQADDLLKAKSFSLFVTLKGYWTNGRDSYPVKIDSVSVQFHLNNTSGTYSDRTPKFLSPAKADDVIWGVLDINCLINSSLRSVFAAGESR